MSITDEEFDARLRITQGWIECAQLVASKTGDAQALELVEFLEDKTGLMIPLEDGNATKYGLGADIDVLLAWLMPITREDAENPDGTAYQWDKESDIANMRPGQMALVMREFIPLSPTWKGLVVLHETLHAWRYIYQPYDHTDNSVFCAEERDVFAFEIRLMRILGGKAYLELLESSKIPEIREGLKVDGREVRFPTKGSYELRLEELFGPAESEDERRVRQTVYWIDAVFSVLEERFKDPQSHKMRFMSYLYHRELPE